MAADCASPNLLICESETLIWISRRGDVRQRPRGFLDHVTGVGVGSADEVCRAHLAAGSQNKIPVTLPHQLAIKYPDNQFTWPWAWLFPSHHACFHPHTHLEFRCRMHEANLQRAVKEARRKLGISVLPHELRHGYATYCMENGVSPRAIQKLMGHSSLETTMG
jgi:integrase